MRSEESTKMETNLGDLIAAIYETALDELGDEQLARRITATLVNEVVQRARS